MSKTISKYKVEQVMRAQRAIWEGTPQADEILEDTCHYFANIFNLKGGTRATFMRNCNPDGIHGRPLPRQAIQPTK